MTESQGVRVEPCREDDVGRLMSFIGQHWKGSGHILARDERLLRWQFDPALAPVGDFRGPTVLLAWHGERIVGMIGLTGFKWVLSGETFPGAWTANWLVVPEMRPRGVALRLIGAIRDLGFQVIGAVGVLREASRVLKAVGFDVVDDIPRWVGVFDSGRAAALVEAGHPAGASPAGIPELCRRHEVGAPIPLDASFEIVGWTKGVAEAWNRHWHEHLAPRRACGSRDSGYVQWRYADHPMLPYEIRVVRHTKTHEVVGLTVYRLEAVKGRPEGVLRIVEMIADGPAALDCLAEHVVQVGRARSAAFADFYCSSHVAGRGLERRGFRKVDPGAAPAFPSRFQPLEGGHFDMRLAIALPKPYSGSLTTLMRAGDLYVTKSDADQDRPN